MRSTLKYILLLLPFLWMQPLRAQSALPLIRARSKSVSINDGGFFDKNAWSLSPKARPDTYMADRTRKSKWVTFYTDIDSIRVKVKPGTRFDFIILLNGKDSCYTRIASAIPPEDHVKDLADTRDTIPFTLTAFNTIQVKALINGADTLHFYFDVGSFDFRLTKDAIHRLNQKVSTLQMGKLVWNHPDIGATSVTPHDMDGKFGWNLFEGKKVEINYDSGLLVISSRLPASMKGYTRSKLTFIRSFVCAKASFKINRQKYAGNFLFDTGSDQALIVDSTWATRQHFPTNLKLIKTSVLKDPRGVRYETKIVLSPLLEINHFKLTDIPTYMLGSKNPTGFEINFLGDDLLKRFNMILDFKNDRLYLKPNKLMTVRYRESA